MARLFSSVRVPIERGAMRAFQRDPNGDIARDVARRGRRVLARAVQICPVRKEVGRGGGGALRASLHMKGPAVDGQGVFVEVGSPLSYAIYVHEPTQPHVISPKVKQALWWGETMRTPKVEGTWRGLYDGSPIFISPPWTKSKSVNHPGTKGQPFLVDALSAAR